MVTQEKLAGDEIAPGILWVFCSVLNPLSFHVVNFSWQAVCKTTSVLVKVKNVALGLLVMQGVIFTFQVVALRLLSAVNFCIESVLCKIK